MTCKDCIHYTVCKALEEQVGMIDARQCGCYKDKSRFIELPCNEGDMVYIVERQYDNGHKTIKSSPKVYGEIHVVEGRYGYNKKHPFFSPVKVCYRIVRRAFKISYLKDFGKSVFLTREEAEKALEGRRENE